MEKPVRYRSFFSVALNTLCYALGFLYIGYTLSYFNSIEYKFIKHIFHINLDDGVAEGFLSSCISIGALLGAFGSNQIFLRVSRK